MKRNKLFQTLLMTGVLLLTGCGETPSETPSETPTTSEQETIKVTGIVVTAEGNATKVEVNKTLQLTAKVTPEGADASVTWSSSSSEVATVSETGLVTGIKEGAVIIKATSKVEPTVYKEIALTIIAEKQPDPESIAITLANDATEVEVGKSLQARAVVSPEKADQGVNWTSSDPTIATVTPAGIIKGIKAGPVTITAISKKVATVKASVDITVKAAEISTTVDWANEPFSNHEAYMAMEKEAAIKVKGQVTYVAPEYTQDDGSTTVCLFLQNGAEGFYVRDFNIGLGKVEVGKSYEIGGFKQWKSGCNSIHGVEYAKEITEAIEVTTTDVTANASLMYDDVKTLMGSKVTLEAVITSVPETLNVKGYSIKVKTETSKIDIRVNPSDVTAETYQAIWEKVSKLLPSQKIKVTGFMNSFGYGKPGSQIAITSAEAIEPIALDDQAKVKLAVGALTLPHTLDLETTIDLPKTCESIEGVTISWTSDNAAINAETGAVTHGERDVDVKLTATAKINGKEASKELLVTVLSETDTYYTEVAKLDFEDALPGNKYGCSASKSGYAIGNVTLGGQEWELNNALVGGAEDDRREGNWAARVQTSKENGVTLVNGLEFDTVEFLVATYGKNPLETEINIAYAVGEATEFTVLPRTYILNDYKLSKVRAKLPVNAGDVVRVRIFGTVGTGQRCNIDNIRLLKTNA